MRLCKLKKHKPIRKPEALSLLENSFLYRSVLVISLKKHKPEPKCKGKGQIFLMSLKKTLKVKIKLEHFSSVIRIRKRKPKGK